MLKIFIHTKEFQISKETIIEQDSLKYFLPELFRSKIAIQSMFWAILS